MKIPSGAWIPLLVCLAGGDRARTGAAHRQPGGPLRHAGRRDVRRARGVRRRPVDRDPLRPADQARPRPVRPGRLPGVPQRRRPGLARGGQPVDPAADRAAARLRRPGHPGRRVHRLHRPGDRSLDVRRLHLAGAAGIRLREQGGAVRRVLLHAGQGCRAGADAARDVALRPRPALLAVRRHERRRRAAGAALGYGRRIRPLHRRRMTGIDPRPGRGESLGATVATNDKDRAGPGERQLHVAAAVSY